MPKASAAIQAAPRHRLADHGSTRRFDHRAERVGVVEESQPLGDGGRRIEDGREEQQHLHEERHDLRHVLDEHAPGGEEPGGADAEQYGGQEQQGKEQDAGGEVSAPGQHRREDEEVEGGMHQRRAERHQRQDAHREDDLLDVAGIAAHRSRRARDGFAEDVENDQSGIQHQPEGQPVWLIWPARLENVAEDEGEDGQHQQRAEEDPQHAEQRAAVAQQHVALDELAKQDAVACEVGDDGEGVECDGAHDGAGVLRSLLISSAMRPGRSAKRSRRRPPAAIPTAP